MLKALCTIREVEKRGYLVNMWKSGGGELTKRERYVANACFLVSWSLTSWHCGG